MVENSLDCVFYVDVHCCEHVQLKIRMLQVSIQYQPIGNTSFQCPENSCKIVGLMLPINPTIQANPAQIFLEIKYDMSVLIDVLFVNTKSI